MTKYEDGVEKRWVFENVVHTNNKRGSIPLEEEEYKKKEENEKAEDRNI